MSVFKIWDNKLISSRFLMVSIENLSILFFLKVFWRCHFYLFFLKNLFRKNYFGSPFFKLFLQFFVYQGSHMFLNIKFEEIWIDLRRNFHFLRRSMMKFWGDFLEFSRNLRRFSNLASNRQIFEIISYCHCIKA